MRHMSAATVLLACVALGWAARAADAVPAAGAYAKTRTIPIGGESRWDYITVDPEAQRLYIAQFNRVAVVDVASGKLIGEVPEVGGAHGVALVPDAGKGFATCGKDGTVAVFDLKTFKVSTRIKAGEKPDAIVYDAVSKRVFCINGTSGGITVIDPAAENAPALTIPLAGKLEFAVSDGQGHVYVNVEDLSELAVVNTKTMKVVAHWPAAPGKEPTGLAMDLAHRRLFLGCSNQKMIVMDADCGEVLASPEIGTGVDGVAFDPGAGVALSANGRDGTATVVAEEDPQTFKVVQTVQTLPGARTIGVDPKNHRFYLPCMIAGADPTKTFGVVVLERTAPK